MRGYFDGDGNGGIEGDVFKVRFCPTMPGRWEIVAVESNSAELAAQHRGDHVTATPSKLHGFWMPDDESAGGRWYRRSDGSHQYIIGNTHYTFWGNFDPAKHSAADNLAWLRETIDREVTFWKLAPDRAVEVFPNLNPRFRVLAWRDREYVLGTDAAKSGLVANLPPGQWTVTRHDVIAKETKLLSSIAAGRFSFDAPASRAALVHFKRNSP